MLIETITQATWRDLVAANERSSASGWAEQGVFATAVGPDYTLGSANSILYVGKSAGPLGAKVGSTTTFATSSAASTKWMVERVNKSAFWQMIDKIDPTRRSLAWTNVCKMDRRGGGKPPTKSEWKGVAEACRQALIEEIRTLSPRTILFATSDYLQEDITSVLAELRFTKTSSLPDGWTSVFGHSDGSRAIMTKHPQGWDLASRNAVISLIADK